KVETGLKGVIKYIGSGAGYYHRLFSAEEGRCERILSKSRSTTKIFRNHKEKGTTLRAEKCNGSSLIACL
ncbi:hypothetical protein TNCV_4497951, partial [Trichonephila clavipes]